MFFNLKKHFKKDQYKTFHISSSSLETGRTMTEMLGTLAIIGILSIGGIAGYNYAMDKYRANVTINDINLRAVDLITQASRGIDLSLAEWGQTSTAGYTFNSFGETDDGMLFLGISGIPKGVCDMVVDTLVEQFDMDINGRSIDETDECGLSDNNIITVYFEGSGAGVTCTPACKEGQVCDSGICMDEEHRPGMKGVTCQSNIDCPECRLCSNGECSTKQPDRTSCTGGVCYNGECQANVCSSNSDCAPDFFCADTNSSCTEAHPSVCKKINLIRKTITVGDKTERWYASGGGMTWWDAKSLCDRLEKRMVRLEELVEGWGNDASGVFKRTERAEKLDVAIGTIPWFWTDEAHHTDSCKVFFAGLSSGTVGTYSRNYNYYVSIALCH